MKKFFFSDTLMNNDNIGSILREMVSTQSKIYLTNLKAFIVKPKENMGKNILKSLFHNV